MAKNKSEIIFENYCHNSGIEYERIQEESSKSPDYYLIIDGQKIIIEVKEIEFNKEEQESERMLNERNYGNVLSNTPGNRVRKKINDSSKQIKSRTEGIYPSILVLYNHGHSIGHLEPYEIRVAMYGLEKFYIAVPFDKSIKPYIKDKCYGQKRKMTEEHNTSISAIGVLTTPKQNEIKFIIYHNKYATVPLVKKLLAKYGISQFELEEEVAGKTADWKEISISSISN
jgi:hypothetical protein